MEKKPSVINDFQSALAFITILPAGRLHTFSPMGMIRFFPVVGLLIGILLALWDSLVSLLWPGGVAAVLDVVFLVAVTGAFHLDGLGDTSDGVFSHRSRERALEIMKDSRTGMMGLVAVVVILALKIAGIHAMKDVCGNVATILYLVAVPSLARSGMLFGIRFLPYGRTRTGTGHDLFEKKLEWSRFVWVALPVLLLVVSGWRGILLLLVWGGTVAGVLHFYKRKMACITGDMLGAMTEVTEAVLFMAAGAGLQ